MEAEGVDVPDRRQRRRRRAGRRAAPRVRRDRARRRRRRSRAICRSRAASSKGIHFAMEYLTQQNRRCEGDDVADDEFITRQGQARRHHRRRRHRRRLPRHRAPPGRARRCTSSSCCRGRPTTRAADNPWPQWPNIFRTSSAHEEGGERVYSVSTERFIGDDAGPRHARCRRSASRSRSEDGRADVRAGPRQRVRADGRPRAAGDGLPRPRDGPAARAARRHADRARQRLARRRSG